jgi:hypothetical protein
VSYAIVAMPPCDIRTKPWTRIIRLRLILNTDLLEYICNENEKDRQIIDTVRAK